MYTYKLLDINKYKFEHIKNNQFYNFYTYVMDLNKIMILIYEFLFL